MRASVPIVYQGRQNEKRAQIFISRSGLGLSVSLSTSAHIVRDSLFNEARLQADFGAPQR
jgi:hypothetical protein